MSKYRRILSIDPPAAGQPAPKVFYPGQRARQTKAAIQRLSTPDILRRIDELEERRLELDARIEEYSDEEDYWRDISRLEKESDMLIDVLEQRRRQRRRAKKARKQEGEGRRELLADSSDSSDAEEAEAVEEKEEKEGKEGTQAVAALLDRQFAVGVKLKLEEMTEWYGVDEAEFQRVTRELEEKKAFQTEVGFMGCNPALLQEAAREGPQDQEDASAVDTADTTTPESSPVSSPLSSCSSRSRSPSPLPAAAAAAGEREEEEEGVEEEEQEEGKQGPEAEAGAGAGAEDEGTDVDADADWMGLPMPPESEPIPLCHHAPAPPLKQGPPAAAARAIKPLEVIVIDDED